MQKESRKTNTKAKISQWLMIVHSLLLLISFEINFGLFIEILIFFIFKVKDFVAQWNAREREICCILLKDIKQDEKDDNGKGQTKLP